MNGALLYRPQRPWRTWLAFACAASVHLTAVGLAKNKSEIVAPIVYPGDEIIGIDTEVQPAPPQHEDATPLPTPSPTDEETFPQENTTLPPVRKKRMAAPTARPPNNGLPRFGSVGALVLYAPRPDYPYVARRDRVTGSGVALATVNPATGNVLDVQMRQSTGSTILDHSAVSALRRWRFRPGTLSSVRVPITYTLTGASY